MSFFLAGSSTGFTPSSSSLSSPSTTTSVPAERMDAKRADSPLPEPSACALADAVDSGSWSGWQVLAWPDGSWDLGDGKSVSRVESPASALAKMLPLPFDDEVGEGDRPLADRQPRAGQVKRKREAFEDQPDADPGHAPVTRCLAQVTPDADNLRAVAHVLATEVASELAPAQARGVGREIGLQLGSGKTSAEDRDDVLAGVMRAALAYPTGSEALASLVYGLAGSLNGDAQQIPAAFTDAVFDQAARVSITPLRDAAGLSPGRPDVTGRLGPLKVVAALLRVPGLTPAGLGWLRASVGASLRAVNAEGQVKAPAQVSSLERQQSARLAGALARAFLEEGDTNVGHALAVNFLDALGACDGLDASQGCELLLEGLGGSPGQALGVLMRSTPHLSAPSVERLTGWVASQGLWKAQAQALPPGAVTSPKRPAGPSPD